MTEKHLYQKQGIRLSYYEIKNGLQPLVMLHAQGVDATSFKNVWGQLSKSYHVYSVDCYGHGESLHDAGQYNIADIGRAVVCFMEDVVQEKTYLLGHSSGGLIAAYAASHTALCSCLILEDPPFFSSQGERRKNTFNYVDLSTVCHNFISQSESRDFVLYYFGSQYIWNLFPEKSREKIKQKMTGVAAKYRKKHPDKNLKVMFWPRSALTGFQGMNNYDPLFGETFFNDSFHNGILHEDLLRGIQCRTVFMKARTDTTEDGILMAALSEEDLERVAGLIADCEVIRFDCGHGIHTENPKKFVECLAGLTVTKKETKSKKGKFLIILCIIAVLLAAGGWALTVMVYNENFNQRFESYEPYMFYVDDFEGLQRTKYEFFSDKGQKLTGYLYSMGENQQGIIVMAHGFGGGGHNSYMDCADYFARHGYYVFAYDATGNDESEGGGVGGMPQGVIDLDNAISFVEESGNFPDLPIGLFGHSWGGYSVCSVLTYHPEIKAVVACSGFNASSDIFEAEGKKQAGSGVYMMMPFVKLHERIKYGSYASNTAMDGFSATEAAVMIVHSVDDNVVPVEYGYNIYYEKYKDNPRFRFIRFEDKGHNHVYNDMAYINEYNAEFDKWLEILDYDYNNAENKERFAADKANYIHNNLDREEWSDMLNSELFGSFVSFYDTHLKR